MCPLIYRISSILTFRKVWFLRPKRSRHRLQLLPPWQPLSSQHRHKPPIMEAVILAGSFRFNLAVAVTVELQVIAVSYELSFSNLNHFLTPGTTTKTSGPNGSIDWLNCGINAGGWSPPFIHIENVITQSLSSALNSGSSPFKACAPYVWLFEKYGGQFNIPPIILASFAMQESSCNPATVGGGGEQGLMQITREKCGGLSDQACRDPVCIFFLSFEPTVMPTCETRNLISALVPIFLLTH